MNAFLEAMQFRHACKLFDDTRTVPEETFREILEAGRLSPSSMGMEPWRFIVITDPALKEKLRPVCWNQPQITTCSHLVAVTALTDTLLPASGYPQKMLARRGLSPEMLEGYVQRYGAFTQAMEKKGMLGAWSIRQCYLAAANMMTAAAFLGVDSCPIEGMEPEKAAAVLELEEERELPLLLAFGYRANPAQEKKRLSLEEIVEYR